MDKFDDSIQPARPKGKQISRVAISIRGEAFSLQNADYPNADALLKSSSSRNSIMHALLILQQLYVFEVLCVVRLLEQPPAIPSKHVYVLKNLRVCAL
jgi:hypothetical protein